jgi:glycerol-3-phosphate dehydrogenase (NAD(P)+)
MARLAVFGARRGGALCVPLADQDHQVWLVGSYREEEVIEKLATTGFHGPLRQALPSRVEVWPYNRLRDAVAQRPDALILAIGATEMPWAIEQLAAALEQPLPLLILTRGLCARGAEILTWPTLVERALAERGLDGVTAGMLAGPCLDLEIAARRDATVVVAHAEPSIRQILLALLAGPCLHARPSADVIGVSACAALVQLLALGIAATLGRFDLAGAADNGALMYNPAGSLFSQALAELAVLTAALGGRPQTAYGPAGAGDLYIASQEGPSAELGRRLGRGERLENAPVCAQHRDDTGVGLAYEIGPTIGAWCVTRQLARESVPLTRALIDAICYGQPLALPWTRSEAPCVVGRGGGDRQGRCEHHG